MNNTKEYTMSIAKANIIAFAMIIPIGLIFGLPMILIHDFTFSNFLEFIKSATIINMTLLAIAITIGIFIHEILHAIGWVFFTKKKWKSISFGMKWEYFTPYCHCDEPLRKNHFFIGAVMPLIVLGIIPVIISMFSGNGKLWFYGFFFTIAAGGDIIAIWMLRKVNNGKMIQDHPSELGFIVVDK